MTILLIALSLSHTCTLHIHNIYMYKRIQFALKTNEFDFNSVYVFSRVRMRTYRIYIQNSNAIVIELT